MNNGNVPMTPSARISALNIVGDLLRKVGVSPQYLFAPLWVQHNEGEVFSIILQAMDPIGSSHKLLDESSIIVPIVSVSLYKWILIKKIQ